jgi:hypothetical protein
MKLAELPWGEAGLEWMVTPHDKLAGRTPNEAIDAGEGHLAERLVEEMIHRHEAFTALADLWLHYRDVAELEEVWKRFSDAANSYPWKL